MNLKRDYWLIFLLALLVRGLAAWPQQQPNYMDAAYYYVTALNLAQGRGFVEDFAWNYLGQFSALPQPSHLYWMPLTSILAAAGMVVGGQTYRAAQLGFVLVSALLAPLSFYAATALGGRRWHGWLAGLLAIFSGFYMPYWTAIDNFALFGVAGSLALLLAGRQSTAAQFGLLFLSGICAGLAHLARADGALVLAVILLFSGWKFIRHSPFAIHHSQLIIWPFIGYLLVMAPWFGRNWLVVGAPLPAAGTQAIWLANYDELFSYGRELSARTFLADGLEPVLAGRWWAFTVNLQTVLAVWGMVVLLPLAVVGGWQQRRLPLVRLNVVYALLLFATMTLVFAFPGVRGGLFHSGAALLPFLYGAAAVGLDAAVAWLAARRRHWRVQTARQVFAVGLLALAVALSGVVYYPRVLKNNAWNSADAAYPEIANWVATHHPGAVVMIGNPPAYRYHGGGLSVVAPNENLAVTRQAARQYGATLLVLDANRPAPLAEVYANPAAQSGLKLAHTFGNSIYLFELEPQP